MSTFNFKNTSFNVNQRTLVNPVDLSGDRIKSESNKEVTNQKESNKDTKSTITVIHQVNSAVLDEYKRIWKTPPTKMGYVE